MASLPLVFCVILSLISVTFCEDTCVKKSPCICQFSNGTGIDLSPVAAAKADFFDTQIFEPKMNGTQFKLTTYYFHPCSDVTKNFNFNNVSGITDTCSNHPLSICRHTFTLEQQPAAKDTYKIDAGIYELMGANSLSNFSADGTYITYYQLPSETIILLKCADTDDQLQVYSLLEPNQIKLAFYSRHACLRLLEAPGRSFGSTLLIIFFSMLIFYLVLGVCTKKFLMGATGLEVIPNLGFWSDLPNLVKDGWAFTINGFKLPTRSAAQTTSPDPNSYDSI